MRIIDKDVTMADGVDNGRMDYCLCLMARQGKDKKIGAITI